MGSYKDVWRHPIEAYGTGVLELSTSGEQDQKWGAKNRSFKEKPIFLSNFGEISAKVAEQLPPLPSVSNNPVAAYTYMHLDFVTLDVIMFWK